MFFSKKLKSMIMKKISKTHNLYALKLTSGVYSNDEKELALIVDKMFEAWRRLTVSKNRGFLKNYQGIVRRLFFEYEKESEMFLPYFYILCVREKNIYTIEEEYKIRIDEEKLKIGAYIKWFSAWAEAFKICTGASVSFSLIELENMEEFLNSFFTNEKYLLLPLISEKQKELLKIASGNGKHKLVSFHGIFRDRHMSVER